MPRPFFSVRADPEAIENFNRLHEELAQRLPFGTLTKADAFALVVNSATAAMANGQLPVALTAPPLRLDQTRSDNSEDQAT